MNVLPVGAPFEPKAGQTLLEANNLSQQDFLSVLVAQLRNQNPLEPQADSDFIAQLAQFDQLLAMQELSKTMSDSAAMAMLGQASSLIGKEIVALPEGADEPIVGIVESVEIRDGIPLLQVGEHSIPASIVQSVGPGAAMAA